MNNDTHTTTLDGAAGYERYRSGPSFAAPIDYSPDEEPTYVEEYAARTLDYYAETLDTDRLCYGYEVDQDDGHQFVRLTLPSGRVIDPPDDGDGIDAAEQTILAYIDSLDAMRWEDRDITIPHYMHRTGNVAKWVTMRISVYHTSHANAAATTAVY